MIMYLIADKGFSYDGRRLKKGELFTVSRRAHARVLIAIRNAHAANSSEIEACKQADKTEKYGEKIAEKHGTVEKIAKKNPSSEVVDSETVMADDAVVTDGHISESNATDVETDETEEKTDETETKPIRRSYRRRNTTSEGN